MTQAISGGAVLMRRLRVPGWIQAGVYFAAFEGTFWAWGNDPWWCAQRLGTDVACASGEWLFGILALGVSIICFGMFIRATCGEVETRMRAGGSKIVRFKVLGSRRAE